MRWKVWGWWGEPLRDGVLPALGLTVADAAQTLGMMRTALSRVLNRQAGISPGMALRLERPAAYTGSVQTAKF